MRILFWQWHSFMNKGIEAAFAKLNMDYDTFFYQLTNWEEDAAFCECLRHALISGVVYDTVFSVNFCPLISGICNELGIHYISWVYDSPLHIRELSSMANDCNDIYIFDRAQAELYYSMGYKTHHMPLAVDTDLFNLPNLNEVKSRYSCEISFVGQMYHTDYDYYTSPLSPYLQGYLDAILKVQSELNTAYIISELITPSLLSEMNRIYLSISHNTVTINSRELEYMLACECTSRERYLALALLSAHFNVDMYSQAEEPGLAKVNYKGYADYYSSMPYIFASSKINLNISLKTIRSGIPLRALDILGCGGFLLTNYKEEICEYLHPDIDCVIYSDPEDMFEKCSFYLSHDDIRKEIAHNGLQTAIHNFSFTDRIAKMFNIH